jgi:hypothetical protein
MVTGDHTTGWMTEVQFLAVAGIFFSLESRLNSGNARCYSVQNLSSSPYKNLKIKIYKTVILQVVMYGCETRFLTLREEHRLRVFENRA